MFNIFTSSKKEADEIQNLLDKNLPNYRKAYSDRTAWLMASLSELVYEDFEKKENLKKNIEFLRMKLEKIYDKKDTQKPENLCWKLKSLVYLFYHKFFLTSFLKKRCCFLDFLFFQNPHKLVPIKTPSAKLFYRCRLFCNLVNFYLVDSEFHPLLFLSL